MKRNFFENKKVCVCIEGILKEESKKCGNNIYTQVIKPLGADLYLFVHEVSPGIFDAARGGGGERPSFDDLTRWATETYQTKHQKIVLYDRPSPDYAYLFDEICFENDIEDKSIWRNMTLASDPPKEPLFKDASWKKDFSIATTKSQSCSIRKAYNFYRIFKELFEGKKTVKPYDYFVVMRSDLVFEYSLKNVLLDAFGDDATENKEIFAVGSTRYKNGYTDEVVFFNREAAQKVLTYLLALLNGSVLSSYKTRFYQTIEKTMGKHKFFRECLVANGVSSEVTREMLPVWYKVKNSEKTALKVEPKFNEDLQKALKNKILLQRKASVTTLLEKAPHLLLSSSSSAAAPSTSSAARPLKIGITIPFRKLNESIWTNGIRLNVLILYDLLKRSKKNYEVRLLNTFALDKPPEGQELPPKAKYLEGIDICQMEDGYKDLDLIIVMGGQISTEVAYAFKTIKPSNRIISYKCGNNYLIFAESCIFKDAKIGSYIIEDYFDEIWHIPQLKETNPEYYRVLYKTDNIIGVPFIWHEKYLQQALDDVDRANGKEPGTKTWSYEKKKDKPNKTICIMEPNINVYKFCFIPLLIAEDSFRTEIGREKIDSVFITNGIELKEKSEFNGAIKHLDLFKNKKISAESRYQISYFLSKYADIIISHQMYLPLNYLYFDACYMGYPVLHNAHLVEDLGYYYEGFNVGEGGRVLNDILLKHDSQLEEYNLKNKEATHRFHGENEKLIEAYDLLIENLFRGIDENRKLVYNPKTNNFF